jgi:hypothetical protein
LARLDETGAVTDQAKAADAERAPDAAVIVNVCAPVVSAGYVIDPEQGVAVALSRAHEIVVAFAVVKANVADVEVVGFAGPEAMATDGGEDAGAATVVVHKASA